MRTNNHASPARSHEGISAPFFFLLKQHFNGRKIKPVVKDISDNDFFKDDNFQERMSDILIPIARRNGKKTRAGSLLYRKALSVILHTYVDTLVDVMVSVILNGDRFVFHNSLFSLHIADIDEDTRYPRKYKYYHLLKGQFPVLRVALSPVMLYSFAADRKVSYKAMFLESFASKKLMKMIAFVTVKERRKWSSEWFSLLSKNNNS